MRLFIVAVLISAAFAARLEHLERSYLPPTQGNFAASANSNGFPAPSAHGNFGVTSQGSQFNDQNRGSNGFGGFGHSKGLGSNNAGSTGFGSNSDRGSNGFGTNGGQTSNGFGSNGIGSHGFGAYSGRGSNGFGSNGGASSNYVASGRIGGSSAATSNQYLPPNYGAPGSNGGSTFGSSIKPACSSCGSSNFGSPQRYTQQPSQQGFGSQGLSIPSTQYGRPQSLIPASTFDTQSRYTAQQEDQSAASRQYLTPKGSSFQNSPQQPFDEKTGYIY